MTEVGVLHALLSRQLRPDWTLSAPTFWSWKTFKANQLATTHRQDQATIE
jgi:hypothetical protein